MFNMQVKCIPFSFAASFFTASCHWDSVFFFRICGGSLCSKDINLHLNWVTPLVPEGCGALDRAVGRDAECRTAVDKQVQSPEDWDWLDAAGEEAMNIRGLLLDGEGTGGHASHWA